MFSTRLLVLVSCVLSACCLGFVAIDRWRDGEVKGRSALIVLKDRVMETTTTTGTGSLTLGGALAGYQAFSVIGDDEECYACAHAVDTEGRATGEWEVFRGTYTASGTTLSRNEVISSSNGGSAVNFGAGTKHVVLAVPAARHPFFGADLSSHTFTREAPTGNYPPAAVDELLVKNSLHGGNSIAVQNESTTGYSAYTTRSHDGYEKFAIGWGNSSAYGFFANCAYIEAWSGVLEGGTPPEFFISQDYDPGSGFKFYKRLRFETNGDVSIPMHIPYGSEQKDAFKVDTVGNVSVGTTIATDATNGFFRIPSCAGIPTGAAADGSMVRDSTNHKVYFRSGGNWIALN